MKSGGVHFDHHQNKSTKTGKMLAEEYNVSDSTIRRNERFAKAVDILPRGYNISVKISVKA